jgi:hypothetical protein
MHTFERTWAMVFSSAAPIWALDASRLFEESSQGRLERVVQRAAHDILLPRLFVERAGPALFSQCAGR